MTRSRRKPTEPKIKAAPISVRHIHDNVLFTADEVWAAYALPPQVWAFRSASQQESLIDAVASRYVGLVGRRIRLRVTTRPYPAYQWAAALDRRTPTPLPDTEADRWSGPIFDETGQVGEGLLDRMQQRLTTSTLADKAVFCLVRIAARRKTDRLLEMRHHDVASPEWKRMRADLARIDEVMRQGGFEARPASASEVEWLMHRSIGLGLPAPSRAQVSGDWDAGDLNAFTDPVHVGQDQPFTDMVRVTGLRNGNVIERYVAVLTMGRQEDLQIPQSGRPPWMLYADRFQFPVEWSVTADVRSGTSLRSETEKRVLLAKAQRKHYAEHNEMETPTQRKVFDRAIQVFDQVTDGAAIEATRVHGWARMAVVGRTAEECRARAEKVIDGYAEQMGMAVEWPRGQYDLYREFIPGEPVRITSYTRRWEVRYLAAAMPNVSSNVGDNKGMYLGYTCSNARRAVMHDPHFSTEVLGRSGLNIVAGTQGAGKSYLVGGIAYVQPRRGIPTVVLDPSGPLARLTGLPELRDYSQHIDLTRALPGTLNPYRMVPVPERRAFATDDEHFAAIREADAERKMLVSDVLRMLLPTSMIERGGADQALANAVRATGGSVDASPWDVVDNLDSFGGPGIDVANALRDASELALARLIFPDRDAEAVDLNLAAMLTVITMPGLVLPPEGVDPKHWNISERLAAPLLHLAAYYTTRAIYGRPMQERKTLILDENHVMGRWGSGRALFVRIGRDTRKHNTAVYAASQNPADALGIGGLANFIVGAFVGRMEDIETAQESLPLLHIAPGSGFEQAITGLSRDFPGEFLYRDALGRVDKVRIDLGHTPALMAALETNAAPVGADWGEMVPA